MSLLKRDGARLYTQDADSLGGLLFRKVPPGGGYRVRLASNGTESRPLLPEPAQPAVPYVRIVNRTASH